MDAARRQFSLLLQAAPDLGAAAIREVMAQCASVDAFWGLSAPPGLQSAQQAGARSALVNLWRAGERSEHWQQARRWQDRMSECGIELLYIDDPDYPLLLSELADAPLFLYVRGSSRYLQTPHIAIVGARKASRGGLQSAAAFARDLSAAGLTVCSGLALGIDGAAHRGALEAGGATTAVLGTGVDRIYPQQHDGLGREVAARGALLSEYPLGVGPAPWHFPKRNRVIAGLSVGTLVVEAAPRSGSLITARLALDYNRDVFALPGSIHSALNKGNHALIREGAKLVETTDHILEELSGLLQHHAQRASPMVGPDERRCSGGESGHGDIDSSGSPVLRAVDYHPTAVDTIAERTALTVPQLAGELLELELGGLIESVNGAWRRCR